MSTRVENTPLLTPGEVAKLLGVDPKTVTRWANEGKISFLRTPGNHRRYSRKEIESLLVFTREDR